MAELAFTQAQIDCPTNPLFQVPAHRMSYGQWLPADSTPPRAIVIAVHGLTRQGMDFAALADYLVPRQGCVLIAPDIAGRGHSEWLPHPMHYQIPVYAGDMFALIMRLRAQYGAQLPVYYLGTSMGGLIAMGLGTVMPDFCQKLLLNDVAPRLEWAALARIGSYVGEKTHFASEDEAHAYIQSLSLSFGEHSPAQWRAFNAPCLRYDAARAAQNQAPWFQHYDPAISAGGKMLTPEILQQHEAVLWNAYDALQMPTLLLRGQQSDLVSSATAEEMRHRGPRAQLVEAQGVGHAPMFQHLAQMQVVEDFFFPEK